MVHDHGAYTARGANLPYESTLTVTLPYDVPAYRLVARAALTNKVPVTPVRGAGHPQAVFAMERLLDAAADGLGIDRVAIRQRNLIGPERMPCTRPLESRGGAQGWCSTAAITRAACGRRWKPPAGTGSRKDAARRRCAGGHAASGSPISSRAPGAARSSPRSSRSTRRAPSRSPRGAAAMGQGIETMLADIVAEGLGCDPRPRLGDRGGHGGGRARHRRISTAARR